MRRVNSAFAYAAIISLGVFLASCGGGGGSANSSGADSPSVSAGGKSLDVNPYMTPVLDGVVDVNHQFSIGFTESLSMSGLNERIVLSDGSKTYPFTFTVSAGLLKVTPVGNLQTKTDYSLTVKAGVTGTDGSVLKRDYVLKFKTLLSRFELKSLTPLKREIYSDVNLPRIGIADVNADGRPDLVEISKLSRPSSWVNGYVFNIYLQDADKGFSKFQTLEFTVDALPFSRYFNNLIVLDIDGDKKPELIVPESGGETHSKSGIRTFKAGPDGKFAEHGFIATKYTDTLDAFDVDGDGRTDLVGSKRKESGDALTGFQVLLGTSNGFLSLAPVPLPDGSYELGIADFDQDGKRELIINRILPMAVSGQTASELLIYSAGERGVFSLNPALTAETTGYCPADADYCREMKIADWRGDGKPVLVFNALALSNPLQNGNQPVIGFGRKPGGGLIKHFQAITGYDNRVIAVRDMDADGIADLVVLGNTSRMYFTIIGGRTDFSLDFSNRVFLNVREVKPENTTIGDVDGDGRLDMVFDSYNSEIELARGLTN